MRENFVLFISTAKRIMDDFVFILKLMQYRCEVVFDYCYEKLSTKSTIPDVEAKNKKPITLCKNITLLKPISVVLYDKSNESFFVCLF